MLKFIGSQKNKFFGLIFIIILSCEKNYQPKPRGLNQINIPNPIYKILEVPGKFQFEKNAIASHNINKDKGWLNLNYEKYNCEILITTKKFKSIKKLNSLTEEAYKLISKHKIKASSINETNVRTKDDKYAVLFELKGEVPTPFQFITTDSNQNFMRAALYFKDPIRGDSLLPVVSYLKRDMLHVLNTLSWDE